jgi:hypothetical protein
MMQVAGLRQGNTFLQKELAFAFICPHESIPSPASS